MKTTTYGKILRPCMLLWLLCKGDHLIQVTVTQVPLYQINFQIEITNHILIEQSSQCYSQLFTSEGLIFKNVLGVDIKLRYWVAAMQYVNVVKGYSILKKHYSCSYYFQIDEFTASETCFTLSNTYNQLITADRGLSVVKVPPQPQHVNKNYNDQYNY